MNYKLDVGTKPMPIIHKTVSDSSHKNCSPVAKDNKTNNMLLQKNLFTF